MAFVGEIHPRILLNKLIKKKSTTKVKRIKPAEKQKNYPKTCMTTNFRRVSMYKILPTNNSFEYPNPNNASLSLLLPIIYYIYTHTVFSLADIKRNHKYIYVYICLNFFFNRSGIKYNSMIDSLVVANDHVRAGMNLYLKLKKNSTVLLGRACVGPTRVISDWNSRSRTTIGWAFTVIGVSSSMRALVIGDLLCHEWWWERGKLGVLGLFGNFGAFNGILICGWPYIFHC